MITTSTYKVQCNSDSKKNYQMENMVIVSPSLGVDVVIFTYTDNGPCVFSAHLIDNCAVSGNMMLRVASRCSESIDGVFGPVSQISPKPGGEEGDDVESFTASAGQDEPGKGHSPKG